MGRMARSCLQSILKIVNSGIAMVGIAMILYALWMFMTWRRHMGPNPPDIPAPWFMYSFLGIGVTLCVVTCSGHIAAETANGCCLCFIWIALPYRRHKVITFVWYFVSSAYGLLVCGFWYMIFVFLLIMVEAAVTVDVILNRNWEEDFPDDPTGNFNEFKDFVRENFETCKWVGVVVVSVQGISMLLAMILKALGPYPERYYESDDDYSPDRVPLLKHYAPPTSYVVADPLHPSKNDSWNIRINSKGNR